MGRNVSRLVFESRLIRALEIVKMPLPFPDLANQEFGRLVVIGLKESGRTNPKNLWLCRCKCGSQSRFVLPGEYLRTNEMWSC